MDFNSGMAVTGSGDQTLALWDIETAKQPLKSIFRGHKDWVTSLDVDWEGRRMLSGAADGELCLWSMTSDVPEVSMLEHQKAVCSVSVDWKSQTALSAGHDQLIRVWDLETQQCTCRMEGHTGPVWCASIDPEGGQKAVTGSSDRHLMVWDLRTKSCVRAMLQHNRQVVDLRVDWSTFQGMSCSKDRSLVHWDLQAAEPLQKFNRHPGSVWCMDVDWRGTRMVTGAGPGDNSMLVWDFEDGYVESEIQGHEGSVRAVAVDWETAYKALEASKGIGLEPKEEVDEDGSPSRLGRSNDSEAPPSSVGRKKRWVKRKVRR